jgi:hypothetical protein
LCKPALYRPGFTTGALPIRSPGYMRRGREAGPAPTLERMGDRVATLAAGEPPIVVPALGSSGYMLFSAPGSAIIRVAK